MTSVISTPEIPLPPIQDELPCDDGIPMETQRHKLQMDLLLDTLQPWLDQREDGYIGGNMFIYFSTEQARNQDFRGPDFFAVVGVPKKERKSWVVWEEGKAPNVVIELLSESTKQEDKTRKKQVYQIQMRVPEYFWYDPFNPEDWAGFSLQKNEYQPLEKDENQRYLSEQLGLALVQWKGIYKGVEAVWLRWETPEGKLLPTERELREQAETKAQQAETKAQKLANKLKELGINPDEV